MIKTDWVKCDWDSCNLVAWYKVHYEDIPTDRNLCQKHYDECKTMLLNWRVESLT